MKTDKSNYKKRRFDDLNIVKKIKNKKRICEVHLTPQILFFNDHNDRVHNDDQHDADKFSH